MFGLGVLTDHHICVPLPITRQRGLLCLLVCRDTPFLVRCGCLLSSYPSWHAPNGPAQLCPFGWCVIPTRHFPQKSPGRNLKIGFPLSPPPNHALLPLTYDLIVLVLAGYKLVRSKPCVCLPSMYVQKSASCSLIRRGLEACLYSLPFILWLFLWVAFWFPAPLRGWYLFVTELYTFFGLFLDCPHFLPYFSVIPTIMTQSC